MKLRTTRYFITLIALLVAGIATTNAQTYNVDGWTPYGSLTLQNLTTKSGSSNKQIEITNSAIQVKDGTNAKTEITNAGLLIQKGNLPRIDIRDHEIKVTTNRDITPIRHGKISVEYLCDQDGANCRRVSEITTGTMPTVPTITIPTTYWKLNSAGTILQTSGGNYGIEINGQGKGISVSDGNVDIQQGSLNTWKINDNQNHGLTIKSQTTINGDLNVSGQNAGITVNDGDIEIVHGNVNVAIGDLTMSDGDLTMSDGDLTISDGDLIIGNDQYGFSINTTDYTITSNYYSLGVNNASFSVNGSTSLNGGVVAYQGLSVHGPFIASGTSVLKDTVTFNKIAEFKEGIKLSKKTSLGTCNLSNDGVIKYANIAGYTDLNFCVCTSTSAASCQRQRINMTNTY